MTTLEQDELPTWTDDEIIAELGPELFTRISNLSDYVKYNTLATFNGVRGSNDTAMSVKQAQAWAAFAATLNPDAKVLNGNIVLLKPIEERRQTVVDSERNRRTTGWKLRRRFDNGEELQSWERSQLEDYLREETAKIAQAI